MAPPSRSRDRRGAPRRERSDDVQRLWGVHSVEAALANPRRRLIRLYASENAARRLAEAGLAGRIRAEILRPAEIDRLTGPEAVHQGLLLEASPLDTLSEDEVPAEGFSIVLDQVTDPHNVGAILRTAAAFGARALIVTHRHSPEATGVLAKSASGALEHVPLAVVQNLARGLDALKARGFQAVGLDSDAAVAIDDVAFRDPVALVLGAEGKGLRQLTRATCDVTARLDLPGAIRSLNVSNAAALAMSAVYRAIK